MSKVKDRTPKLCPPFLPLPGLCYARVLTQSCLLASLKDGEATAPLL